MHRRKWYRVTWIWGQKILRKKIGNKDGGSPDFVELSLFSWFDEDGMVNVN